MTVEDFIEEYDRLHGESWSTETEDLAEVMEAYANQKVLEALEKEVPKAYLEGFKISHTSYNGEFLIELDNFTDEEVSECISAEPYHKTQVEPNYKK